jgi:TolA-binding protein
MKEHKGLTKNVKLGIIVGAVAVVVATVIIIIVTVVLPANKYGSAERSLTSGNFDDAIAAFVELGDYKDSTERVFSTQYSKAEMLLESGNFEIAEEIFVSLGNYSDSSERALNTRYRQAKSLVESSDYERAEEIFTALGSYSDSSTLSLDARYQRAELLVADKDYNGAIELFTSLGNHKDSADRLIEVLYLKSNALLSDKDYDGAYTIFMEILDYKESTSKVIEIAKAFLENKEYNMAADAFAVSPTVQNQNYAKYSIGMNAYVSKDYAKAVECLIASNGIDDSTAVLLDAYYLLGKEQFFNKKFHDAKDSLTKGNQESDVTDMIMACDLMIAEDYYKNKDYGAAISIYSALPADYEYEGVSPKNRLDGLKIYSAIENLIGTYNIDSGKYEVRQTHNSTGIWHNWTNIEKGRGSFEIEATVSDDGSVKLTGMATGRRYTSYSSISSGVYEGNYSASFDIDLKTSKIPTTLYDDGTIVLKYAGGTKFTLSYSKTDRSQDVYFSYRYTSNYTFSK